MMDLTEKRVDRTSIFQGHILHVYRDKVELPNGALASRELIEHGGAVCVLPLDETGNVTLVRQYRYPVERLVLEAPAGKIDPGEEPFHAAERELSEETGQSAESWTDLGKYLPSPGYSGEVIYCYLASGLSEGVSHPDEDEFLFCEKLPLDEAAKMVMNGEICDGKTAFVILKAYYLKQNNCL